MEFKKEEVVGSVTINGKEYNLFQEYDDGIIILFQGFLMLLEQELGERKTSIHRTGHYSV